MLMQVGEHTNKISYAYLFHVIVGEHTNKISYAYLFHLIIYIIFSLNVFFIHSNRRESTNIVFIEHLEYIDLNYIYYLLKIVVWKNML